MERKQFVDLLIKEHYTTEDRQLISDMLDVYPWFGLARCLQLKADYQLEGGWKERDLAEAVIYSPNREFLYRWVRGEESSLSSLNILSNSEIEFMDEDGDTNVSEEYVPDATVNVEAASEELSAEAEVSLEDELEEEGIVGEKLEADVEQGDEIKNELESGETVENGEVSEQEIGIGEEEMMTDDELISATADVEFKAVEEKEDSELDYPELDEAIPVPVMDDLEKVENDEENDVDDLSGETGSQLNAETVESGEKDSTEKPEADISNSSVNTAEAELMQEVAVDIDALLNDSLSNRNPNLNKTAALIEEFLKNEPKKIQADQDSHLKGDVSEESVQEDDSFITDTLAKIYMKQGLHAKAIYAYERLSLKYPEKSAYFAAQIEKIKNISNV